MAFQRFRRPLAWIFTSLAGGIVVLSVGMAIFAAKYGSVSAGTAYMRGERLLLLPRTLEVGTLHERQEKSIRLELVNLTDETVHILGVKPSCSCITIEDELPIELPRRESHFINLRIRFAVGVDRFQHTIIAYSDVAQGSIASATITGRNERASQIR